MKKLSILMLHLRHGGIEKQTITMANELSKYYDIEIVSLYNFNNFIAYDIDKKIKVKYLLNYGSNKKEFKLAIKKLNIINIFKESFKAIKVLYNKNKALKKYIKNSNTDIMFSTRIEFAKLISKVNHKNYLTITQEHNHIDTKKYGKLIRKSCAKIDYLVVMSELSKKIYSNWLNNTNTKVVVIPNILEKLSTKTSEQNNNTIIAAGRLHPVKNYTALIEVFNLVHEKDPTIKLIIVGDGEQKEILNKKVKKLDLANNVVFTGMVSSDEVNRYMCSSDLFIMTSLHECFPMVLLEANSCGVPVISFDVPAGPKVIIKTGKNGYLIENNNYSAMANKIIDFIHNDLLKKKMSKFSIDEAKNYTKEKLIPLWIELLNNEVK